MTIIPIITWNIHYFPIVLRASIEKTLYICTMYIHSAFCNFLGRCIWKLVIFGIKLSWKNMNQDSQDILWSDGIRGWPGRSVQSPSMEENFENVLSVYFTSQSFRLEDFQFCLWRWWWKMNSVYTYQPTQLADAHCHALKSKNLPHLDFFEIFRKWWSRSFFQKY